MLARTLALASAVTALSVAPAHAAYDALEGSWSFEGGEVLVTAGADGALSGTVVRATRFSPCPHPVSEVMWRFAPPAAGSAVRWGTHQWTQRSTATGKCAPDE